MSLVPSSDGFECRLDPTGEISRLTAELIVGSERVTVHPDSPDVFIAQWPVDERCTALLWQGPGSYAYGAKVLPTMKGGWTTQAPGLLDAHPIPESLRDQIPQLRFWSPPPKSR
ncbi:MAG: hypothetical protein U0136_04515 [Bdellovibrionota bacterium]